MSTFCLVPVDHCGVSPSGGESLPVFLAAHLAREYRELHGLSHTCEIAEVPAIELLRRMLEAKRQGVPSVAVNPRHMGPDGELATELALDDPWRAFAELLRLERASMIRGPGDEVPEIGFSDPRPRRQASTISTPASDEWGGSHWAVEHGRAEHDTAIVDASAAQLLSVAGSVELAKHAVDVAAEFVVKEQSE